MKVRKMVAGLAAVSMLAAFSAQAVMAADTVSISAEKVEAKAGAEFTLNVELGGVPATGLNAIEFAVTYDPAVVSVTGVTAGAIAKGVDEGLTGAPEFGVEKATGLVTFTYAVASTDAAYLVTENGVYATLTGTVAADAKPGDKTEVSIVAIDRPAAEGSSDKNTDIWAAYISAEGTVTMYDTTVTNGSVTVVGEDVKPTDPPQPGKTLYGDVDCNDSVNLLDVVLLNKHLMLGAKVEDQGKINADVDLNEQLNPTDSLNILKYCVKLIELPVK